MSSHENMRNDLLAGNMCSPSFVFSVFAPESKVKFALHGFCFVSLHKLTKNILNLSERLRKYLFKGIVSRDFFYPFYDVNN